MRKIFILSAVIAGFLLVSCAKDKSDNGIPDNKNGFKLSYSVLDSDIKGPTTRGSVVATSDENAINTLYILFFQSSDNGEGVYIETYDASPPSGEVLDPTGVIDVNPGVESKLDRTSPYNMLFIANIERYIEEQNINEWLNSFEGKTENIVLNEYSAINTSDHIIVPNDIFMSARGKKKAGKDQVDIKLIRGVARIDIVNNAIENNLVYASVWNAYPSTSIWENDAPKNYDQERVRQTTIVDNIENNKLEGGLYCFENNVVGPAQKDYKTTCLIIGLKKGGDPILYYRINVNLNSIGQSLVRNNAYKITIQRVLSDGATNPNEAYESGEMLLDVNVNGWIEAQEGNVKYDGDNIFAVPTTKITFTPDAETREFSIFTSGKGELKLTQNNLPSGLYAELNAEEKKLTVRAEASLDSREGWIEVSFGAMRTIIYVFQTGEREEYLELSKYNIPTFPFSSPGMMDYDITVTSSGSWTATIYSLVFSFDSSISTTIKKGGDGDFFRIFTRESNSDSKTRYSFVLISLDANPEVNRAIVLSQRGTGGISWQPDVSIIRFNAQGVEIDENGIPVSSSTEIFPHSGTDASKWIATLIGANAGKFAVTPEQGNTSHTITSPSPDEFTGDKLSVTALRNIEKTEISANLRVRLFDAPTVFKDVQIKQLAHTVSVSHPAISKIPVSGGETPAITVTSSDDWEVDMNCIDCNATLSQSEGTTGQSFKVIFGPNNTIKTPKVEVFVRVKGTGVVSKTITIYQNALIPRPLTIKSHSPTYGSMTGHSFFDAWNEAIRNPNLFGPTGLVYTAGSFKYINDLFVNDADCIYNLNCDGYPTARIQELLNWIGNDHRNFLVVIGDLHHGVITGSLTKIHPSFECMADNVSTTARKLAARSAVNASHQKVWDYIVNTKRYDRDVSNPEALSFYSDGIAGALTSYPSTTVPILVSETTNRVHMAIDPVLKLLFIGDCDLFRSTRNNFTQGTDHWVLMVNTIAFMVEAAQYGDVFLDNFR